MGSEAADEIEFALDLRKALEQTLGVIKVIDESERLRRIRADVKTDGRPGPIDRTLALHLVEQRPRAITQADRECAARLTADDIAIGLAIFPEDALNQSGKPFPALAENIPGLGQPIFLDTEGPRLGKGGCTYV